MGIKTILGIPFLKDSTDLKGHVVGQFREDVETGYIYRLIKVAQACTNDLLAAGEVITAKTAGTFEGTNDVSTGLDATYPITLGVMPEGCDNAAESTASVTNHCWVLVRGYHATVKTNGDDDIAVGNILIPAPATDGACDSLPGSATNTADGVLVGIFGRAAAADVDAANTVAAFIDVRF